jgi:transcriptional regulator of acetoin/glycerol metabolism
VIFWIFSAILPDTDADDNKMHIVISYQQNNSVMKYIFVMLGSFIIGALYSPKRRHNYIANHMIQRRHQIIKKEPEVIVLHKQRVMKKKEEKKEEEKKEEEKKEEEKREEEKKEEEKKEEEKKEEEKKKEEKKKENKKKEEKKKEEKKNEEEKDKKKEEEKKEVLQIINGDIK